MSIIQNFMNSVNWYSPSTDAGDWQNFKSAIGFGFTPVANVAPLFQAARIVNQLYPQEDHGMWDSMKNSLQYFLQKYGSVDPNSAPTDPMQYDYVSCFLNDYASASHNNDLWQSMYDCARTILVCANLYPPSEGPNSGALT